MNLVCSAISLQFTEVQFCFVLARPTYSTGYATVPLCDIPKGWAHTLLFFFNELIDSRCNQKKKPEVVTI